MSAKLTSQRRISPHEGQEGGSIGSASAAASFGWRNGCASPGEGVDSCRQRSQIGNPGLDEFKDSPGLNYLEVGCYEGGSAVWMLENVLTHEESTLTCIDPFLPWFGGEVSKKRFLSNVKLAGGADRTNLIIGYSQVELRKLPLESFDIVYIDGDHSAIAVLQDAVLSWPLLKPGGLVIFDDYAWQHSREPPLRPLMALDFFTEIYGPQAEIVHRDYQLILRKRR